MTNRKDPGDILIVEDSPTQAERLRFVLENHGYRVTVARDGREAASFLAGHQPDLVISDILMPEVDGYQLCRFMRQDPNLRNVPVILLTALSDPVDVLRALECGADNFIIKPFEEQQLIQRVQPLLLNQNLRGPEGMQVGLEIVFQGQKYFINSDRLQILNLLLSTYEAAVEKNDQLFQTQTKLQALAAELEVQSEELQAQNEELRTLTEELRQSERYSQRQAQILRGINRIFHEALTCETEEQLGETCLAVAVGLTGSTFGFIGELNKDGNLDDLAISYFGWEACKMPGTEELILPKNFHVYGTYGVCLREGRSEIANEPGAHPDRVGIPEGHPPIAAFLGVPLKRGKQTIGMIGLGNKEGGYTQADQEAVEALAPVMVEAFLRLRAEQEVRRARNELEHKVVERTTDLKQTVEQLQWEISERQRAQKALRKSGDRLQFLATQLLNAQETERKRLSLELHDELGQSLMVLKMQMRAVQNKLPPNLSDVQEEVEHSLGYVSEIIEDVRRMSRALRPSILEDLGLRAALQVLFEEFSKFQEIQISSDIEDLEGLLSPEAQIAIYRIFQESLTNIAKHAQATHIMVGIKPREGDVTFQVEDNGNGFELQEVLSMDRTKRGLGLTAMDERIRLLGGQFHISSQPGTGTKIFFVVPRNS